MESIKNGEFLINVISNSINNNFLMTSLYTLECERAIDNVNKL